MRGHAVSRRIVVTRKIPKAVLSTTSNDSCVSEYDFRVAAAHIVAAGGLGWVHRQQLIVIEFLRAENRLPKERLRGRRIGSPTPNGRGDAGVNIGAGVGRIAHDHISFRARMLCSCACTDAHRRDRG